MAVHGIWEGELSILKSKVKATCGVILVGTLILSAFFFVIDSREVLKINENGNAIVGRNEYGKGEKSEQFQVEVQDEDGKIKENEIELILQEQEYKPEEIRTILEKQGEKLDSFILGDNPSMDEVRTDLNLPSVIPDSSIEVRWESSDYTILTSTGEVRSEHLSEEGIVVTLTAFLSYKNEEVICQLPICVYAPKRSAKEQEKAEILAAAEAAESASRTKPTVELPSQVNGKPVIWSQRTESRAVPILLLGVVAAISVVALDKQKRDKDQKMREKSLMLAYPELVNQLTILIGAGMTVRKAWQKLVYDYEKKSREEEISPAYEEMSYTWHEIQSGKGESECYEQFGKRCKLQSYVKLGALLSQNLRKGNRGLTEMLKAETANAFEERKALAKKLGEEAGTKLLAPMFIMLAVVLVMIIVPAFFSIQT